MEECTVLVKGNPTKFPLWAQGWIVKKHSKPPLSRLHCAPDHETISWLEYVKEGRHGWEGQRAYEKRSVEIAHAIGLFLTNDFCPSDNGIGTETKKEGIETFVGGILCFCKRVRDSKYPATDWTTI
jgi:hypothetical protein